MLLSHPFLSFRSHINSLFDDFGNNFIFNPLHTSTLLFDDDDWVLSKADQSKLYEKEPSTQQQLQQSAQQQFSNDQQQVSARPSNTRSSLLSPFISPDSWLTPFNFPSLHCKVNIHEEKDKYVVQADLPGVDKKDIELNIEDDYLTLRAERRNEVETSEAQQQQQQPSSERVVDQTAIQQSSEPSMDAVAAKTHNKESITADKDRQAAASPDNKQSSAAAQSSVESTTASAAPQRRWVRREVSYGSIERRFKLSRDVDQNNIRAKHEDGVLTITLPRVQNKQQQHTIEIQ